MARLGAHGGQSRDNSRQSAHTALSDQVRRSVTQANYRPPVDLFPFESKWYDLNGYRIHYVHEGRGRPLLLLHGNATFSFVYREMISQLRDNFRCVAPDYPGFGLSDHPQNYGYTPAEHAECVIELVRALDLRDMVVMGQDWGGPIGVAVALSDPDRIGGLVLANTWCWPSDSLPMRLFGLAMSTRAVRWLVMQRNPFVEDTMRMGAVRPMPERIRDVYRQVLPTPASRRAVAILASQVRGAEDWFRMLERESPVRLRDIPVRLVWGMRDPAFGHETILSRWHAMFPRSEVVRLTDASHYVQEDNPGAAAEVIRRSFAG